MRILRSIVITAGLVGGSLAGTHAQTADQIIEKHIAAIGGKKNWKNINSIKLTGTVFVKGADMGFTDLTLNGKGERREYTMNGNRSFEILTPEHGWVYIPQAGRRARSQAMPDFIVKQYQSRLDISGPLMDYKDKGNKIEYIGKGDAHGVDCYKLHVTYANGNVETLYIDAVNYYLVLTTVYSNEEHKEEDGVKYSDFKELPEGIVYPMTITEEIGAKKVQKVEINIPVVDSVSFDPTRY